LLIINYSAARFGAGSYVGGIRRRAPRSGAVNLTGQTNIVYRMLFQISREIANIDPQVY
jgi:hypothetical protein